MKHGTMAVFLCAALALGPVLHAAEEGADWKMYRNMKLGFSVKYPPDWELQDRADEKSMISLLPPADLRDAMMTENITLAWQPLPAGMDIDGYTKMNEEQLTGKNGAKILESKDLEVSGRRGHRMVNIGSFDTMSIQFLSVWSTREGKAFIMAYSAREERFKEFEDTAEKIIASFEFI